MLRSSHGTAFILPACLFSTVIMSGIKILGFINWSWWWILAPLLLPGALFAGFVVALLGAHAVSSIRRFWNRRKK